MSTPSNSLDISSAGLVKFSGTGFSGVTTTNHNLLLGASSNGITNLSPGSAGTAIRSTGTSSDPSWTTGFQVSSSDVMTNSSQPAFFAYLSSTASNVTGDGTFYTFACNTVVFDNTSSYNNSTYTFTAPVSGVYYFYGTSNLSGIAAGNTGCLIVHQSTTYNGPIFDSNPFVIMAGGTTSFVVSGGVITKLSAGNTAKFVVLASNGSKVISAVGGALNTNPCSFGGFLIC